MTKPRPEWACRLVTSQPEGLGGFRVRSGHDRLHQSILAAWCTVTHNIIVIREDARSSYGDGLVDEKQSILSDLFLQNVVKGESEFARLLVAGPGVCELAFIEEHHGRQHTDSILVGYLWLGIDINFQEEDLALVIVG